MLIVTAEGVLLARIPISAASTSKRGKNINIGSRKRSAQISVSEATDNTARDQAEEVLLQAGALQSAIFNSANGAVSPTATCLRRDAASPNPRGG